MSSKDILGKKRIDAKFKSSTIISDKLRLLMINILGDELDDETVISIAKKIKNDNLKVKVIKFIEMSKKQAELIKTIEGDELRLKAAINMNRVSYYEMWDAQKNRGGILQSLNICQGKKYDEIALDAILEEIIEKYENIDILEKLKKELESYEEIIKIEDDDEKIKQMKNKGEYLQMCIAKTLKNDEKKIQVISKVEEDEYKVMVAETLKDDEKKIQAISMIEEDEYKVMVAETIKDDEKKIQAISMIEEDAYKVMVAETIKDDNKKIKAINLMDTDDAKAVVIESIENSKLKEENIAFIKNGYYKGKYIYEKTGSVDHILKYCGIEEISLFCDVFTYELDKKTLKNIERLINDISEIHKKSDDKKIEKIESLDNEWLKLDIIFKIKDENKKIKCLNEMPLPQIKKFRSMTTDFEFVRNNIGFFISKEGFEDIISKEVIEELYEKNNSVVSNIDFRMLQPKYIKLLGKEKINFISCYPDIQDKILKLEPKQLDILVKCIEDYMNDGQTEEWTVIVNEILKNLVNNEYVDLVANIEDLDKIDIDKLKAILQNKNVFNITDEEEIERYEQIKKEKTDLWIKSDNIKDKKLAVLEKIFGHDIEYARRLLEKYGEDIESLSESDVKYYVKSVQEIMNCNSNKILEEIYNECKEVTFIDKMLVERKLKTEFCKMYNNDLFKLKGSKPTKNNIYYAGTEFKMIITSIGAYSEGKLENNYKSDWNRADIASSHFCTSYIRNDMIGTAPIEDICYGFDEMAEDSLVLSGAVDIWSADDFVSTANRDEVYYSPDMQINKTGISCDENGIPFDHIKTHNEMCFRRIQNGEKKQPSYIVVFKKNGKIPNLKKAKKAQKDWGGVPIVVIDVDECLTSEQAKVQSMIQEYRESKDPNLAKEIYYKIRNNRVTDFEFCKGIDITEFEEKKEEVEKHIYIKQTETVDKEEGKNRENNEQLVTEEDMEKNYGMVTAQERKRGILKMKNLFRNIERIKQEDRDIG